MKFWRHSATILGLSIILVIAGCGSNAKNADSNQKESSGSSSESTAAVEKLKIKTSFYPMYEFTLQVAGDLAEVENLVPAGVEPHDWEPSPKDMAAITDADVFVYNGAGMESWADQVLDSAAGQQVLVIEASEGIEIMEGEAHSHDHEGEDHDHEEADHDHEGEAHGHDEADHDHEGEEAHSHEEEEHDHEGEAHDHDEADHDHEGEEAHSHDHDHGGLDPHVWLSPAMAIQQVRNIEKGLSEAAPEHKEAFKVNADAYVAKLEALDKEFQEGLKDSLRKDFITQHAAFSYLAKQYGLTQVPIAGLSPEQEPSAAQMAEIIEFAKAHNVKTIFFETLVSSKVADTIATELGAKSAVLNPIEGLTEEDIAGGSDYLSLMRQNLEALKAALNE